MKFFVVLFLVAFVAYNVDASHKHKVKGKNQEAVADEGSESWPSPTLINNFDVPEQFHEDGDHGDHGHHSHSHGHGHGGHGGQGGQGGQGGNEGGNGGGDQAPSENEAGRSKQSQKN